MCSQPMSTKRLTSDSGRPTESSSDLSTASVVAVLSDVITRICAPHWKTVASRGACNSAESSTGVPVIWATSFW